MTFFFLATTVAKDLTADCICGSVVDDEDILLPPIPLFELNVGTWQNVFEEGMFDGKMTVDAPCV